MAAELAVTASIPFYLDWKFWSVAVSFLSLFISLAPHFRRLRRPKLDIEVYQRIFLTHRVGNPNAQLHLILTNIGGKRIKVKGMHLELKRSGEAPFKLPAATYLHKPNDVEGILMTPFRLPVEEAWSHTVNFVSETTHQEQRAFKAFHKSIADDLIAKRVGLPADAPDVEGDVLIVKPAYEYFDRLFKWNHGEYEVTLCVTTDTSWCSSKNLRMTIFETDSQELQQSRGQLKFGRDIFKNDAPGVVVELVERN
jgi:hypothetical protein